VVRERRSVRPQLGQLVEASRARQPPASTVVSPRLHLELCAVSKQDRCWREGRGGAVALNCQALERSQFGHTRSDLWAKSISRICCWGCIGDVTTAKVLIFRVTRIGLQAKPNRRRPIPPTHRSLHSIQHHARNCSRQRRRWGALSGTISTDSGDPLFAPSLPPLDASVVKGAGSFTEGSARLLQC
jgi:hypothetical protein